MSTPAASVGIIMRTKDRPDLLRRALTDVSNQSFRDWVLAVVNDGGDAEVVERAVADSGLPSEQLVILHNVASRGMEAASNQGIAATQSQYLVIHDDDDTWDPDFLSTTTSFLDDNPDAPGVTVRTEIVFEQKVESTYRELDRQPYWPQLTAISYLDLLATNRFVPISFLYRRSLHTELGLFREDLPVVGDWEFHLRVARYAQIPMLPDKPLAFWHHRRGASGTEGNSVYEEAAAHSRWDKSVRDEALREGSALGGVLYTARAIKDLRDELVGRLDRIDSLTENRGPVEGIGRRLEHLEAAMTRLEAQNTTRLEELRQAGVTALVRRKYWATRHRVQTATHRATQAPRVAILGDIGQPVYHVGDEAMSHAAVEELQARGLRDLVMLTRDTAHTMHHFGDSVTTAPTWPFPWPPEERQRELARLTSYLGGDRKALPPEHPGRDLIETIRRVDAVLIAGGGNMNSRYGWLLYERAAVVAIAAALRKRIVVSGQTLGPELSPIDRGVLTTLLSQASLVGLREKSSYDLAVELAPTHSGLAACLDDASFVDGPSIPLPLSKFIAATFAPVEGGGEARQAAAQKYAEMLTTMSEALKAPVVFLPHMATPGLHDADEAFHAQIAALMNCPSELRTITSASETAALTRRATAVATSRYHPAVFACAASVPVIAISPDEYTMTRLRGALRNWHITRDPIPLNDLTADADGVVRSALAEFPRERQLLGTWNGPMRETYLAWWDRIADALTPRHLRGVRQLRQTIWSALDRGSSRRA